MKSRKASPLLIAASLVTVVSSAAFAVPIYDQSFDYGASPLDFQDDLSGDGWSDNTGTISYEPSSGLTYSDLSAPSGGALVYDFASAGSRSASQTTSYDFSSDPDGEVYWMFTLGRIDTALTAGGFTEMRLEGGSVVNILGFGFTDTNIYAKAWQTSGGNQVVEVSGGAYTVGSTVGFLAKVTKGTGASPSDTQIEFWFNPDLTNLGTADGSILDSKFARDGSGNAIDEAYYGGDTGGGYTWDEVRFTKDFGDIVAVPEPGSVALFVAGGMGIIALQRRRRRES